MNTRARLPADHPLRRQLADEVHARPATPVESPGVASCLALADAPLGDVRTRVQALATAHDVVVPVDAAAAHAIIELPGLRIKWERHSEFTNLLFACPLPGATLETVAAFPSAFDRLPRDWLAELPGQVIAASDIVLVPAAGATDTPAAAGRLLAPELVAGARTLEGAASIYTDFLYRADATGGRTRWLVVDHGMGRARAARIVQRLVEIETYRMMALLAFPVARTALQELATLEQQLAAITAATSALHGQHDPDAAQAEERRLLDALTRVAADVERSVAATAFRFSAAQAYWELVRARVAELREQRVGDMRTLSGFLSRRMAPAMSSCAAAARRQDELSARVERASALLRTRVDIAREEQNQALLAAMERRGKLSLRLQQTVEGLSIAAVTYYMAGLVGYLAKAFKSLWPPLEPDWVIAAAIPVLAFAIWHAVRRIRRELEDA
ncbi:MAG: DUF3422 domain-containing protein [Gammaproteobacteria bacterium]|nr:DUF3422 domain-containing protein [Gammaproteobacteria bacterium]